MVEELGITVKKEDDMPEWYSQVVIKGELADNAPVKGCMILRPNGYALWEGIQVYFNELIKSLGVRNVYFPMFIPEEFFHREAKHAEGFNAEVAWVERKHEKEAKYAIRPTSETIIYDSFGKWLRSWRDLPIRINQWVNICRWETKDCKMFLRSREFLWQEGHCAYQTQKERDEETLVFLDLYEKVLQELLAVPVIKGEKTEAERFAGADQTYTIEGFMPDGKGLQLGTSHNLSQGFAKAFNVVFKDKNEKDQYVFQNSWGISWRVIGGMIMTHGDNKGVVVPPMIAENKAVIIPILFEKTKSTVLKEANKLVEELKEFNVILDDREDQTPGFKFNKWELNGVPVRIELGPKDLDKKQCVFVRRDNGKKEFVKLSEAKKRLSELLDVMQEELFNKAKKRLNENIEKVTTWSQFEKAINEKKFVLAPFCGDPKIEEKIKEETAATSRCIPINQPKEKPGKCIKSGRPAKYWVYFAKAY